MGTSEESRRSSRLIELEYPTVRSPNGSGPRGADLNQLPFVPHGFICDSANADSLVETTTTWLAANIYKGCSLGCTYCFRHRWHPSAEAQLQSSVDEAVAELRSHPQFVPHETPVTTNISSTDAMLPKVRKSTVELMRRLDQLGFRNPFGVTTKLRIPDQFLDEFASFRNLRPVVLVSYSAMPRDIEPLSGRSRIETMRRSRQRGIPTVLLYKPLVRGWNDRPELIESVMKVAALHATAIVYGGLRLDDAIAASITASGREIPYEVEASWGTKEMPKELEELLTAIHRSICPDIPLYRHTSCAVSLTMVRANYNHLYLDPAANCSSTCPRDQVDRCQGA